MHDFDHFHLLIFTKAGKNMRVVCKLYIGAEIFSLFSKTVKM